MHFNITVTENPSQLGQKAAQKTAEVLKQAIKEKGSARIILATGASQFETLEALLQHDIDWSVVEVFHLDEYVGLAETHKASFRKYLKERFLSKVSVKAAYLIDGEADAEAQIKALTEKLAEADVDVAMIGIGENAHVAFNDPPANFETEEAFIVVKLDEACKAQQVREGWFEGLSSVPETAITMTVRQILKAGTIVSAVPHTAKAEAVYNSLQSPVSQAIPASILKTHPNWNLYLDHASAAKIFSL